MGRKSKNKGRKTANSTAAAAVVGTLQTQEKTDKINGDQNENGFKTLSEVESDIFTLDTSPIYGRYLKTKKKLEPGELILKEKYALAGPMRNSSTVCLGCHKDDNDENRNFINCPKCSWPVCDEKCSNSMFHLEECKFFQEKGLKAPDYLFKTKHSDFGSITVLRGLINKLEHPETYQLVLELEAHNFIRKNLQMWKENERNVVDVIQNKWKIGRDLFTADEIHTICGILEVNSFEIGETHSYRGIFPISAMMAHECIPNATHFEDPETGELFISASIQIPEDSTITISYAFSLEGTFDRRKMLLDTKFFDCYCNRCVDPLECETNFSTLICPECNVGHVVNNGLSDLVQDWVCNKCQETMNEKEVAFILNKYRTKSENISTTIKSHEIFINECKTVFHANHFIPFGIKFNLCQAYGRYEIEINELSKPALERKAELCREVMKVLDNLSPGHNVTRGLVLYELQAAELILARREFESKNFRKAILKKKILKTLKILEEAISILELTSEQSLAKAAKEDTLPGVKYWLTLLN